MSSIPSGWTIKPLGDVATLQRGFDLPVQERVSGDVPVFAANGPVGTHNMAKVGGPGVVTGRSGTLGAVHYTESDYWPLNTALWVKDFHGNDPKWVAKLLKWMRLETYIRGTGVPTLNRNLVHVVPVLVPLSEQRRIAAILDRADAVRRKRQQAIALTEELLRSAFLEMFGDPVTNPKGWEVDSLANHILHANNGLSRRRKTVENEGQIVLRLQDVKAGYIDFSEPNRIALEDDEKKRYLLVPDDLVFIRVNGNKEYVGRCSVYKGFEESVYHNDHIIRIQTSSDISTEYLAFVFNHPSGKSLLQKQIKTSAGQYTVSQKGIESIELPFPPRDLQDNFIERCKAIEQTNKQSQSSLATSQELFNSLLQRAFRGEL